jgi:hypothetical protein
MMQITSSSISGSDTVAYGWRGFALWLAVGAPLITFLIFVGLVVLDPFDTSRLTPLDHPGVAPQRAQTSDASAGRDPAYDSAIIGNSQIETLDPDVLSAATGLHFVNLAAEGTGPNEELAVMDYFRRMHGSPRAFVIGMDATWCLDSLTDILPFPHWLYDPSDLHYLRGMFRLAALERVPDRIAILTGHRLPAKRNQHEVEGDLAAYFHSRGRDDPDKLHRLLNAIPRQTVPYNSTGVFAAVEPLNEWVARAPATTAIVFVWTPVYIEYQPVAGSSADAMVKKCHAAYDAIAGSRPLTAVVDWSDDRPESHVDVNFYDPTHYRPNIARRIEQDIASTLIGLEKQN